jgi:hypothetical protein
MEARKSRIDCLAEDHWPRANYKINSGPSAQRKVSHSLRHSIINRVSFVKGM